MIGRVLAGVGAAAAMALAAPAAGVARVAYWRADFEAHTHKVTYGQAPVFMADGNTVLFGKDFKTGSRVTRCTAPCWPDGRGPAVV